MSVSGPFYPVNESLGYPLSWNISSGGVGQGVQGGGGGAGTSSSSIDEGGGAGGGASGFSPAVIAIVGLLGTAFLLISSYRIIASYCKCYCCCCYGTGGGMGRGRLRRTRSSLDSFDFNGGGFIGDEAPDSYYNSRGSNFGVDEAMLKTLPILTYGEYNGEDNLCDRPSYSPSRNPRSSPSPRPSCSNGLELGLRHGVVGGTECVVCLGEFQYREALRLLPKCNHAFHVACIDAWLRAHSRCPLCRTPIFSPVFSPPLMPFFSPAFSPPPPPIFSSAFPLPPPPPPPWVMLPSLSAPEEDIENPVVIGGNSSLNPNGGPNIAALEEEEEERGVAPLPNPPRFSSANQSSLQVPLNAIGSPSLATLEEERWGGRGALSNHPRFSLSMMRSPLWAFPNVIGNPSQNLTTLEEGAGAGRSIPDPPRFSLSALRSPCRLFPRSLSVGTSRPDILKGAPSSSLFSPPLSSTSPWSSNLRRWASPSPSRLPWRSPHVNADPSQASLEASGSNSGFGSRIGRGRYYSLPKSEPHRHSCSSFPTNLGGVQSVNSKRLAGLRSPRATFIFKRSFSVGRHSAHQTNQTE